MKVGDKYTKREKSNGHNMEYEILQINQFATLGKELNRVIYCITDLDKIDWRYAVSEPIDSFKEWFGK